MVLVVVGAAVAVFVGVAVVGIIAAIAIPSMLRARLAANESAAIGDIRTVISAEVAYAGANGGFFDNPGCLGTPAKCIPNFPADGPAFLQEPLVNAAPAHGYVRTFYPGPPAPAEVLARAQVAPMSLQSFAITAAPITPGQTGVRAFCGDATGQLCSYPEGAVPAVSEGVCPKPCRRIQ
jgi:type IV pilus assembly protein PilA